MALRRLWVIAYRDLGRNRRRTIFSLIAVALGLALLMLLNGLIAGVMEDSLQSSIRLQTGHVQLRNASYKEDERSLLAKDLLRDPDTLVAQASAMNEVRAAAPVLWAGGFLSTLDDTAGLQIYGIDTTSAIYDPIREAIVAGQFLAPDDRGGILMGKRLADSLGLSVGSRASLTVVDADGQPDEGTFTVRGLFSTGIPAYDESAVFMPLSKAQAFTRVGGDASAIVILLRRQADANKVAAALRSPGVTALTWYDLNQVMLQAVQTGMSFYVLLDGIVMMIVAVIIANTLLMAVFERIREMGILAALGMKGRQIMLMFLFEATALGLGGVVVGIIFGLAGVAYLARVGIPIGDIGAAAQNIALGTVMYARFVPGTFAALALCTLLIIVLASFYPAWFAARREPVEALRAV
jgi:ABC-type lipoprotein release transport system permease subunit